MDTERTFSRRDFLKGTGKAALLGGFLSMGLLKAQAATANAAGIDPLVWVWKFSADGPLHQIRDTLSANGLGVIFKTHDGTHWMDEFDDSPDAVTGPGQVANLASTFEQAGVGFHAWCVVQGIDPIREAQMCAEVLNAGARDMYLDLEPKSDGLYWQGTAEDALAFGQELRRLAPNAWLVVAPDSRPWQAGHVPLAEFMSFSNAVAPQAYWETFQGPSNIRSFASHGYHAGPEGVTPELVIDASAGTFQGFGRPIYPIGQGDSSPEKWQRFIDSAVARGMSSVSLWRYGVSHFAAFGVLQANKAQPAPAIAEAPPAAPAEQPAAAAAPPAPEQPLAVDAAGAAPGDGIVSAHSPAVEQQPGREEHVSRSSALSEAPVRQLLPDTELLELHASGQIEHRAPSVPLTHSAEGELGVHRTVREMKERIGSGLGRHFLDLFR